MGSESLNDGGTRNQEPGTRGTASERHITWDEALSLPGSLTRSAPFNDSDPMKLRPLRGIRSDPERSCQPRRDEARRIEEAGDQPSMP